MILLLILLIPPLNIPLRVTSGFGEWRELRTHAGVDFSTNGMTGLPVLAVDDGVVKRVKVSYGGYGKALYLELKDGRIAVYAHLSSFTPKLDTFVYLYEKRYRRYCVDIFGLPKIEFKKGDVVALSGMSGVGPPHLHFEIRKDWEHPINPFNFIEILDTLPPRLRELRVIPFEDGVVDGLPVTRTFKFIKEGEKYNLEEIPRIYGKVRLEAFIIDSGDGYEINPYCVSLYLDGEKVFYMKLDSLDYDRASLFSLIYNLNGGKYIRLYHMNGFIPPVIHLSLPYLSLTPGLHRLSLEVTDFANNKAKAEFMVEEVMERVYSNEREPDWDVKILDGRVKLKFERDGVLLKVDTTYSVGGVLEGDEILRETKYVYYFIKNPLRLTYIEKGEYRYVLSFPAGKNKMNIKFEDFEMNCDSGTFADEMFVYLIKENEGYRLYPENPPILKPVRIKFLMRQEKEGIFLDGEFSGSREAMVGRLGIFTTALDTIPPQITLVRRYKKISGFIKDELSGVDPNALNFYLDGEWVPVDYDITTGRFDFVPMERVKRGYHFFKIVAYDNMGNKREGVFRVRF